ncbi:MAG: hypothetical protein CMQ41_06020 [Gammaproteobacteria bacterium]|nr:hypothetical protein [Gammaproteobacteria bacterium]|tara:strand:+ start:920 stop:1942 length:1023 start_codon:yes stop_codon:yes gene_type:complete
MIVLSESRIGTMKKVTAFLALFYITISSSAQDWDMPRTPDGQPDIQGIWSNASQTPLARPEQYGNKGFLTATEAEAQMQAWRDRYDELGEPIDGDRAPPTDGNANFGYNSFWWDPRTQAIEIGGQYRTSIIIDPPDGQIPYIGGANPQNGLRAQWRAIPGVGDYDGHELRPLAERCLLTFGSGSGPPMLPILYNNNYQIVQTTDYVMILVEMVHDARIIPLNREHNPNDLEKWMGDSVGYWDDDTLVVTTKNFHSQQSFRGSSDQMVITERFDLLSKDKIKYAFTIEDPLTYSRSWTGEVAMDRKPKEEVIYEYACHEGNYAFPGIMGGARRLEMEGTSN